MNIIAFDLGGSGGKVILGDFTNNKLSLKTLNKFEHSAISINGGLYWDILQIFKELSAGIKLAIKETNDSITSIGIDSFCNDFAIISPFGDLLTQMHSYRDERTKLHMDEIYNIMSPNQLYNINGNQNALFNTLIQLAAMNCQNQSYLFENGNKLLFLPDLLIYFLSGKMLTEYTLASVSQIYDYSIKTWNHEILNNFNIPEHLFADIVQPGTVNCTTNSAFNISHKTKGFDIVSVCEHDTASAFLASPFNKNCAIISCGTWALVGTETQKPIINNFGYHFNIANEGGYEGHHRILHNVMGTWIIQEIRSAYQAQGDSYTYSQLEALAEQAEPFQYIIDVDDEYFYAPGNMPERLQNYCKEAYNTYPTTIGEMVRCVYESLALKYFWNINNIQKLTETEFGIVNIIGGGSQSKLMCQFTANACNCFVAAGPVEATALGNILVQLLANKQIASIEEGQAILFNSFPITEYYPQNIELWKTQYEIFIKQYNLK
ncbi:MAG: rhamnulokinase [Herbinix sp.]|jgi:sugar (pentulose or hexulose) kinase|nr:rhamnulokinase [Herbinix sp.]